MAFADRFAFEQELQDLDGRTRRADRGPTEKQRLGRFTIAFLIINRTVGSGIFVTPAKILRGTDSVGLSLILWLVGGIFALSGVFLWLEFGLSTPRHVVRGEKTAVPRSGGEKNYLEFVYRTPERLTTCMYGIAFILLGNLAGNALAFGTYCMKAATGLPTGDSQKPAIVGIAIGALSVAVLIHIFTRKGGIWLNNAFAGVKIALLLAIIVLGILKAAGVRMGGDHNALDNFDHSFEASGTTPTGIANSLVYVVYSFSGFEQPFYVLSEFRSPRKRFPRYTLSTVFLIMILYIMVNAAYYFVLPKEVILSSSDDIATLFLLHCFGNQGARKAMAAVIATSIFGNIVVMTFTASRVKQEIAKEGILPFSLFWATGVTTPAAKVAKWFRRNIRHRAPVPAHDTSQDLDHQEQTPAAALLLHWFFTIVLIAVTVPTTTTNAYNILLNLYTFTIKVLIGLFVALGMIYLKLSPAQDWKSKSHFGHLPTALTIVPACIYFAVCGFLLVMPFVRPQIPLDYSPYYLVPVIGITVPLWGCLWWGLLHLYMRLAHTSLKVTRVPYVVLEAGSDGKYIQAAELVDHEWNPAVPQRLAAGLEYRKVAYVEEYDLGARQA